MPHPLARPRTRTFVSGIVAIATMLLVGGGVALAATRAVAISDFAFSPRTLTINVGDRVTWTNSDQVAHTATANNGAFDTGLIDQGYIVSNKVNVRVIEDVERAFFRVNPADAKDLRDAVNPGRKRDQERTKRQRRR